MSPTVSICIPAYRESVLVCRALRSVAEQDFADYEVIVTDDSEDDAVRRAVEPFLADQRVRYVRNEKRLGSPANWNRALSLARGTYVKLLHQDDWFTNGSSLGRFVELLAGVGACTFGFSAALARGPDEGLLFRHAPSRRQLRALAKDPACLLLGNFVGAPSAVIFRRDGAFRFEEGLKWLVDIEAYVRLLRADGRFAYSAEPLINISASSPHQVTRSVEADLALQAYEHAFVLQHLRGGQAVKWRAAARLAALLARVAPAEVSTIECRPEVMPASLPVWAAFIAARFHRALSRARAAIHRATRMLARSPRVRAYNVSYSQCGEDLIVAFVFMWLRHQAISYLDIGANHPSHLSNTYFFYLQGHRGVLVEPDPELYRKLRAARPRDRSLNVAVGVDGHTSCRMFLMTTRTLNTISRSQAEEYQSYGRERVEQEIEVPQTDINELISKNFEVTPNFVSIDVEGLDYAILEKWDFARFRPEVICVETLTFTQDGTERKLSEIVNLVTSKGYFVYADTYINTIFVDTEVWKSRPA